MASTPQRTISQRAVIGQTPVLWNADTAPARLPRCRARWASPGRSWRGYSQKPEGGATAQQRGASQLLAVDRPRIEQLLAVAKLERDRAGVAERHRAVEARTPAGVAGAGTGLLDLDPHCVLVAIDPHLDDALRVAGRFTLAPERAARAAEIPGLAARDGSLQGVRVHVGDHQHLARAGIGRHAGEEPVGIELRRQRAALLDLLGRAARGEWEQLVSQEM